MVAIWIFYLQKLAISVVISEKLLIHVVLGNGV